MLLVPKAGRKEQKLLQERLSNLKKNDRVVLSSGIHGIVANVNADAGTVTVRVDEGTNAKLTVDRAAIRSVEA
jgi:preprotein translocase subunit YajC